MRRELRPIRGLALLQEPGNSFSGFGRVAQLGNALDFHRVSVTARVDRRGDAGPRAALRLPWHRCKSPRNCGCLSGKLLGIHHLLDDSKLPGALGLDHFGAENQSLRRRPARSCGQTLRVAGSRKQSYADLGQSEFCRARCNANIRGQHRFRCASQRAASDFSHRDLRQAFDARKQPLNLRRIFADLATRMRRLRSTRPNHIIVYLPLTLSVWPVMKEAASDDRSSTAVATSSGFPIQRNDTAWKFVRASPECSTRA